MTPEDQDRLASEQDQYPRQYIMTHIELHKAMIQALKDVLETATSWNNDDDLLWVQYRLPSLISEAEAALQAAIERGEADKDFTQALTERDEYHDMADKLAEGIALHFDGDIGEHSSSNSPWDRALDLLDSAACSETMRLSEPRQLPGQEARAAIYAPLLSTFLNEAKKAGITHLHLPVPEPLTLEEIRGAVARGWCTERNAYKTMDVELAEDIADAVWAAIRSKT